DLRPGCYVDVKLQTDESSFFSYDSIRFPTKERLAAIRGTAHDRHTDLGYVPLLGTMPRDLCLKDRTVRSCQSLPVLHVVESFPGAPSPLGSKEPNQLFFSRYRVFVASRPQRFAPLSLRATATMRWEN